MTIDSGRARVMGDAPEAILDCLDQLSGRAIGWLTDNLEFFDPYAGRSVLQPYQKVKAALELALLAQCWARLRPGDARLAEVAALVRRLWQLPGFQQFIVTLPGRAPMYGLTFAALAPAGTDAGLRTAMLERLEADGFLLATGKSPGGRLEIRYYADKAGFAHQIEPYEELIPQTDLVRLPGQRSVTLQQAYNITHLSFYISDYGSRPPGLEPDVLERARKLAGAILASCVRQDMWDLVAELLITLTCLGGDPVGSAAGAAGIRNLARAQLPSGAIPGRSAAERATEGTPPAEFFHRSYHTTAATILMSLIVSSGPKALT